MAPSAEVGTIHLKGERLPHRHNRALTVGLVALVTSAAFENLAATTALGAIGRSFHTTSGLSLVLTSYLLAEIVGVVALSEFAKARGPRGALRIGGLLFQAGLLLSALSPNLWLLVLARVAQGLGGGSFGAVAYVVINDHYPSEDRPYLFFLFSMAWVAPSLVAPGLAGIVANRFGWPWVFAMVIPLAVAASLVTERALATKDARPPVAFDHHRLRQRSGLSILLAGSVFLALWTLSAIPDYALLTLALPAGALGAWSLWHLLPPRSFSFAPGVASVVPLRMLSSMAFFGIDGYMPLALFRDRGFSLALAGITLTVGTFTWTAGSYWHSRVSTPKSRSKLFRLGIAVTAFGVAANGVALGLPHASGWLAVGAWSIAALGMGIAYVVLSVSLLDVAPRDRLEESSASNSLADTLGIALGTGIAGGMIAATLAAGSAHGVAMGLAIDAAWSLVALAVCYRFAPNIQLRAAGHAGGD